MPLFAGHALLLARTRNQRLANVRYDVLWEGRGYYLRRSKREVMWRYLSVRLFVVEAITFCCWSGVT